MIYVLIYFLIGSVIALAGENILRKLFAAYVVERNITDETKKKLILFATFALLICFWPTLFLPSGKKGDKR